MFSTFIHIVALHFFLLLNNIPFCGYTPHFAFSLFIRWWAIRFFRLSIMSNAAMNTNVKVIVWIIFFPFLLGVNVGLELLGHVVILCLIFEELPVFHHGYTILHFHQPTSTSLLTLVTVSYNSHSSRCDRPSHCGVWHIFPWSLMILSIFACAYWQFVCVIWRNVVSFAHLKKKIVFWLLGYKNPFYILDTSPLPNMICKYFLAFCGLSFHYLDGVRWSTKLLNLMKSNLFIFYCLCFWYHS